LQGAEFGHAAPLLLESLGADRTESAKRGLEGGVKERIELRGAEGEFGFDAVAAEEPPHGREDLVEEDSLCRGFRAEVVFGRGGEVVELLLLVRRMTRSLLVKPCLRALRDDVAFP
jgi:hypothetical protein